MLGFYWSDFEVLMSTQCRSLLDNRLAETEMTKGAVAHDLMHRQTGLTGTKGGHREGCCGAYLGLVGMLASGTRACRRLPYLERGLQ
jgi:xanthine dehydrogenase iron-sulfur cluster and FAD-binding subunit A